MEGGCATALRHALVQLAKSYPDRAGTRGAAGAGHRSSSTTAAKFRVLIPLRTIGNSVLVSFLHRVLSNLFVLLVLLP